MTAKQLNLLLIEKFPELKLKYQDEVDWQDGDETGSHIVYGDVFAPYVEECIDKKMDNKLKRIFTFIEEIDTVLDEIMKSDYYSEELFGTKEFMRAQWVGHNLTYQLALSGDIGFKIARSASGSDDPIQSSQELDIRCLDNLIKRQRYAYKMIEIILDWGN